jgi:hypothetical protein
VHAEIYRTTDETGAVIYSDQPQQGAEVVKLPGVTTFSGSSIPTNNRQADRTQDQGEFTKYTSFEISTPANDATIRENSGRVEVSLSVAPELDEADSIVYEMNGKKFKVKGTSHVFDNVDRGTHTLKAHIVDDKGRVVSPVASTTFHLKRISTLIKPKAQ